jgi:hypothetical protein
MKHSDKPPDPQPTADLGHVLELERARVAHIFLPCDKSQADITAAEALVAVKACIVEAVQKAHEDPLRVMDDVDGSSGSDSEAPKMADHSPFFTEPFVRARSGISKPTPQAFTHFVSDLSISSDNELAHRSGGSEHGNSRSASVASFATHHSNASHGSSPGTIFSTTSGASTTATSVMPSHHDHASSAQESKESFFSLKGLSMTKLAAPALETESAATTPKTSLRPSPKERAADARPRPDDSPDSIRRRFSSISLLGRRPLLNRSSTHTSVGSEQKPGRSSPSLAPLQFGIRRVSFPWLYGSSKADDSGCKGSSSPLQHSAAHSANLTIL